jgi:transposase
VDEQGRRLWHGTALTDPEALTQILHRHGCDLGIGVETGPLVPWLMHGLRRNSSEVVCLDARHAKTALAMQLNKNDPNDAEGSARIIRTGSYRSVHVKSLEAHRIRPLLGPLPAAGRYDHEAVQRHPWDPEGCRQLCRLLTLPPSKRV